jgi:hypothetical protein
MTMYTFMLSRSKVTGVEAAQNLRATAVEIRRSKLGHANAAIDPAKDPRSEFSLFQ